MLIVDSKGNAELVYNNRSYNKFFEVTYGKTSPVIDEKVCEIRGMSRSFPLLSEVSIDYQAFDSLESYLANPSNIYLLISSNFLFQDPFKLLLWDLGQIAIICKSKGIEMDTSLDRIFVLGNANPRVKSIATIPQDGDNNWLNNLIVLFKNLKDICHKQYSAKDDKQDEEFEAFIRSLERCFELSSGLRGTHTVFESSRFFWTKYTKLRLINKFGDMVDVGNRMFVKGIQADLKHLLGWRDKMENDAEMKTLYANDKTLKNPYPESKTEQYNAMEVDLLLKFLRSNTSHFRKYVLGKSKFNDELEVVDYYDSAFPDMMTAIYKGAKAVANCKTYNFDFI